MPSIRTLLTVLLLALAPCLAMAETYYVAPVLGDGMDPVLLKTVQRLVVSAVNEAGQTAVDDASQAAWTLKPELLPLGSSLIVTLAKVKAGAADTAFAGKLKAANADELDVVTSRLTRSVLAGQDPEASAKVGEVTQNEATQMTGRQSQSRQSHFFGLGPMRFNNLATPDGDSIGYYLAGGEQFEVTPHAAITVGGETSFKAGQNTATAFVGALQLGGQYYFTDGDTAPFFGLDFGYGSAVSDGTNAVFGFSGGARLGVAFFRTTTTQMSVQIRQLNVFSNNGVAYPGHTGLVLGVNF